MSDPSDPNTAMPAQLREAFWDPDVLARLRRLSVLARTTVDGVLHGLHRSRALGPAVEFVDFKEYMPGDPLRDLDWRVYARSDRLVIRRYRAESELPSILVLDASADLGTGDAARLRGPRPPIDDTKFGYALALTATLATFLSLQGEPVGLSILGGTEVPWRYLAPRSGRRHLATLLTTLAALRPAGRADLGESLVRLAARVRRHSLVALISDLMEESASYLPALSALGRRRTDLRVFRVWDPGEMALVGSTARLYYSPEDEGVLPVDPVSFREAFLQEAERWRAEIEGELLSRRIFHVGTPSDRPLREPLLRFIAGFRWRDRATRGGP
jgi:uncharacterized protein (DUF58 family)